VTGIGEASSAPAGCDFCAIAAGETGTEIFYRSGRVVAFQPRRPATRGHTLVVPTVHLPDFLELEPGLAAELAAASVTVGRALRDVLRPDGMNMITSAGAAATQTVFHLHLHLVPRWWDDEMTDLWPRHAQPDLTLPSETTALLSQAARPG
jgi:histidine triad (HIT) family protein